MHPFSDHTLHDTTAPSMIASTPDMIHLSPPIVLAPQGRCEPASSPVFSRDNGKLSLSKVTWKPCNFWSCSSAIPHSSCVPGAEPSALVKFFSNAAQTTVATFSSTPVAHNGGTMGAHCLCEEGKFASGMDGYGTCKTPDEHQAEFDRLLAEAKEAAAERAEEARRRAAQLAKERKEFFKDCLGFLDMCAKFVDNCCDEWVEGVGPVNAFSGCGRLSKYSMVYQCGNGLSWRRLQDVEGAGNASSSLDEPEGTNGATSSLERMNHGASLDQAEGTNGVTSLDEAEGTNGAAESYASSLDEAEGENDGAIFQVNKDAGRISGTRDFLRQREI